MSNQSQITDTDLLLVVDIQYDFCPGGALGVAGEDEIIPIVNRLAGAFRHVGLTQDWHPPHHSSFASSHPGRAPFTEIEMPYGPQTLWPDHCVQGTQGARFHADLHIDHAEFVIRKGYRPEIDSYSALYENDRTTPTGLAGYLRERGIRRLFVCGLALDYCVYYSCMDARREGFEVAMIEDACRAIDLAGSRAAAMNDMRTAGIAILDSHALIGTKIPSG